MSPQPKLQVNLADPDDIRAKVSDAEKVLAKKQQVAREAQEDADHWEDLVRSLKEMAGIISVDEKAASNRPSPAQDLVVKIVMQEGKPMRPVEVAERLEAAGHEVASNNAVNAALYAAAQAGRLRRPGPRQYAPPLRKVKVRKKPKSS